jgi:hypothetical protein
VGYEGIDCIIQSGGSGAGGALSTTHDIITVYSMSFTRACNVSKECGPMITSQILEVVIHRVNLSTFH